MGRSMFSINLRFLGVFALAAVVAISIANVSGPSADADISIDVVPEGQYDLYAEVIIDSGAGPEEIHFFASVDLVDRTVGVGVGCDGFQFASSTSSPGGIFGASGHKPGFATTTAWNLGLPSSGSQGKGQSCVSGGSNFRFKYGFTASPYPMAWPGPLVGTGGVAFDTVDRVIHSNDVGPDSGSTSTIVFTTFTPVTTSSSPLLIVGAGGPGDLDPGVIWECWAFYDFGNGPKPGDTPEICPDASDGSIDGRKIHDYNGDGVHDPGEPGLNDWTIELRTVAGALITSTSTQDMDRNLDGIISSDETGWYLFDGLNADDYIVSEVLQSGWTQTAPSGMSTDYSITLGAYGTITGIDFLNSLDEGAFPCDEELYIANEGNGGGGTTVVRVNCDGTISNYASGFNGTSGLQFDDTTGLLYISDDHPGIHRADSAGNVMPVASTVTFSNPNALDIDSSGRLLIADSGDRIMRVTVDGAGNATLVEVLASGRGMPQGIAEAANGDILFTTHDGRVHEITAASGFTTVNTLPFGAIVPGNEGNIKIDSRGNIYTGNFSNEIWRIDPTRTTATKVAEFVNDDLGSPLAPCAAGQSSKGGDPPAIRGFVFDADDDLFFSGYCRDNIYQLLKVDLDAAASSSVAITDLPPVFAENPGGALDDNSPTGLNGPFGLAFYAAGAAQLEPPADLRLEVGIAPNLVAPGGQVTIDSTVFNDSAPDSDDVVVFHTLPSGWTFGAATSTKGSCDAPIAQSLRCDVGTIAGGAQAAVSLTAFAGGGTGTSTVEVTVAPGTNDFNRINNRIQSDITVAGVISGFGSVVGTVLTQTGIASSTLPTYNLIVLLDPTDSSTSSTSSVASDGSFSFTGVDRSKTYDITASADGHLSTIASNISLPRATTTLVTVTLLAGDVDGDGIDTIRDLSAAAAVFGQLVTNHRDGSGRVVDLNGDGVVDALDISVIASNFGSGGQTWSLLPAVQA